MATFKVQYRDQVSHPHEKSLEAESWMLVGEFTVFITDDVSQRTVWAVKTSSLHEIERVA